MINHASGCQSQWSKLLNAYPAALPCPCLQFLEIWQPSGWAIGSFPETMNLINSRHTLPTYATPCLERCRRRDKQRKGGGLMIISLITPLIGRARGNNLIRCRIMNAPNRARSKLKKGDELGGRTDPEVKTLSSIRLQIVLLVIWVRGLIGLLFGTSARNR